MADGGLSPAPDGGAATASPPPILIDTVLLLVLRLGYFHLARRYLLAQLNPALRELQKPGLGGALPTHHVRDRDREREHRRDRANSRASIASAKSGKSVHSVHSVRSTASGSGEASMSASASTSNNAGSGSGSNSISLKNAGRSPTPSAISDDEDDGETEDEPSSYPPSGNSSPIARTIHISQHRGGDTSPRRGSGSGDSQNIEMGLLGAKLREARPRQQVLELAHARAERSGSRAGKRAARGLGRVARTLAAACFAESMNLLTLVVFQTLGILHARARQVNFAVSLHVLLAIILVVVPLVQCLLFTYRSRESTSATTRTSSLSFTSRLLISVLPFALYIFAFTRIPPYITVMDDWEGGAGVLAPALGRVVVLGVLIMASLSGIGAVKTAWDYLEQAAGGGRKISDADVVQAERSLYRVRHDVVAKRDDINRLAAAQPERSGWMGGVFGSKASQQMAALKAELQGLQAMETELSRSLAGMKSKQASTPNMGLSHYLSPGLTAQKRQDFRSTLAGTVVNLLGYVFAAYCVARLLMCLVSIFVTPLATSRVGGDAAEHGHGNTNGDWISLIIALGLSHLPFHGDIDIPSWSRGIALLLTGLLILSSLTMVLRWLTRVLRMTSKTVGAGFLLLTLGQLYATYVISLLVQLRSSLPENTPVPAVAETLALGALGDMAQDPESAAAAAAYAAAAAAVVDGATADDSLLRSLPDFRVFGRLFDAVFLVAALGTIVYRYVAMRVERSDDGAIFGVGR